MVRRDLAVLLLAAVLAGAPLPLAAAAPGTDDAATAALAEASKLLQKGGYVKSIEAIDTILRSGKVPAELAAKALLVRAEANEKLDRNVNAYADYNAALWMENLSAADRKRAEEGHGRLAKALGMDPDASPGAAPTAAPAAAPAKGRAAAAPTPAAGAANAAKRPEAGGTAVQEAGSAQQTSSSGGDDIGNFFSNLFSSSPAPGPGPAAQGGAPAAAQPKASEPSSTAALVATPGTEAQGKKPAKAAAKTQVAAQQAPAAAAPAEASGTGKFAIQLAAIGEEDKAIAEADRIGKKYGADFGGRKPSLMIVPTNDGGTLYKVVVAPFETRADGQAACEQLKTKGLTCMVVTKK